MAIVAGYTSTNDGEYIVIGTYDNPELAETAIEQDTSNHVKEYWIASSVNSETNEPDVLGIIDV